MSNLNLSTKARLHRPGLAATEFAIAGPLLLLLALGGADFGRVMHHYQIVAAAARSGAENAAAHGFTQFSRPFWEAEVRLATVDTMSALPDFNEASLGYSLSERFDTDGVMRFTVDVSYPFRTLIAWPGIPQEFTMRDQVEFRRFR